MFRFSISNRLILIVLEHDENILILLLLPLTLLILLKSIHIQVVNWQVALQYQTPLPVGESLPQLNHHREFGS
jgi:hypothetical protein